MDRLPDRPEAGEDGGAPIIPIRSPQIDRQRQLRGVLECVYDAAKFAIDGDVDPVEAAHRCFSLLAPVVAADRRPGGSA